MADPRDGVSVIVPAFNEEQSILRLLEALEGQTLRPWEIIVADGGSTDRTRELVGAFAAASPLSVMVMTPGRSLPGRGRNVGLARATREWAACIDAGTVPRRDWLERLVEASERAPAARIVYGQYEPVADTFFRHCLAVAYLPPPGEVVRSVASLLIHRSVRDVVGPFREDLRSAEDLLFFRALDSTDLVAVYAPDAFVEWQLERNVRGTFRKYMSYSCSSLRAGLWREWQYGVARFSTLLLSFVAAGIFFRPALFAVPLLPLAWAVRRVWKWYPRVPAFADLPRLLMVAWLKIVVDTATICGTFRWLVRDRAGRPGQKG